MDTTLRVELRRCSEIQAICWAIQYNTDSQARSTAQVDNPNDAAKDTEAARASHDKSRSRSTRKRRGGNQEEVVSVATSIGVAFC